MQVENGKLGESLGRKAPSLRNDYSIDRGAA